MCNDYDATLRIIIHHNLYVAREAIAIARLVEDTVVDTSSLAQAIIMTTSMTI